MPQRYANLDGTRNIKGFSELLRWQLGWHDEREASSPRTGVPVPVCDNDGSGLRGAVDALTWIGHATYLVQLGGVSALIDPVLSPSLGGLIKRNVAPGLSWAALPKIDVVFVTHNHRDHMDEPTLRKLGPDSTYVVPQGLGAWFKKRGLAKVVEMEWWQQLEIRGLNVTFVPSQHWTRRGLLDTNTSLWGGYVIERGGVRVYHSGDTAYFEGFAQIGQRCGKIDAAMLPIGAYAPRWFMKDQHMNPEDAAQAFVDLGARQFIAMHWGTFKLTDEHLLAPPEFLTQVWQGRALPDARRSVLAIGETYRLGRC